MANDHVPCKRPKPLRSGSRVRVVAPSSPCSWGAFWSGVGWLRARYRVEVLAPTVRCLRFPYFASRSYLAAPDDTREEALLEALLDPAIEAVFAARGGYGAQRILQKVRETAARSPKWLVGFSDITALHSERLLGGVFGLHAPNVSGLATSHSADRAALLGALEGAPFAPLPTPLTIRQGEACGIVVGGNLAMVHSEAAAGRLEIPKGAIVVLEDVGERPYRIDRLLTTLAPRLSEASAVVFGEFSESIPGADGVGAHDVLRAFASQFAGPIVAGAPFGHGRRNHAIPLGAEAVLSKGQLTFRSD